MRITMTLQERLPQVSRETRRLLGLVVRKAAFDVEAAAKAKAPVDTGNLRASIAVMPTGELSAEVRVGAEYGAAVEYGTGVRTVDPDAPHQPIVIRPKHKKALSWPGAEHPVAQVVQLGQPPRPYLTPAVEEVRPGFEAAVGAAIRMGAKT
jgi:HK97 gp10 family phage protein